MGKGFKLIKGSVGDFEQLTFENHKGISFSILPKFGARLNNLTFRIKKINKGYIEPIDAEEMGVDRLCKSAILFPFPNRLDAGRYSFEGKSYQFPIDEPEFNTALHGFMTKVPFVVESVDCRSKSAKVKLTYEYLGEQEHYPFPFTFQVSYKIDADQNFKVKFKVKNNGGTNMPFGLGWHPYFDLDAWDNDFRLQLPAVNKIEVNDRLLPDGMVTEYTKFQGMEPLKGRKLDDCFELISSKWRTIMASGKRLDRPIEINADAHFKYIQVYQPPNANCVAIEPVSCNIDAFNNTMGLSILEPGGVVNAEIQINPYKTEVKDTN